MHHIYLNEGYHKISIYLESVIYSDYYLNVTSVSMSFISSSNPFSFLNSQPNYEQTMLLSNLSEYKITNTHDNKKGNTKIKICVIKLYTIVCK